MDRSTECLVVVGKDPPTHRVKIILTLANYFTYLTYGIGFSILGPARIDIAELLGVTIKDISVGIVLQSITYCIAALMFGWAFTRVNRQMSMIVCQIVGGLAVLATPLCRSLWPYNIIQSLLGITGAAIDVGANAWILEMWQDSSSSYMLAMHCSWAAGGAIIPFIVNPFLLPEAANVTERNASLHVHGFGHDELFFIVPFAISAIVLWLSALLLLILYFKVPYHQAARVANQAKKSPSDSALNNNCQEESEDQEVATNQYPVRYFVEVVALGSLLFCFYSGVEVNTFYFIQDYVYYNPLHLTKSTGGYMLSLMSTTFAVGRGISILIYRHVSTTIMLYIHFGLVISAHILLLIFGDNNVTVDWVISGLLGIGFSCIFPTICSFLEERINVNNVITGCFLFASSASTIINTCIIGIYIESHPNVFVHVNLVSLIVVILVFLGLHSTDITRNKATKKATITAQVN